MEGGKSLMFIDTKALEALELPYQSDQLITLTFDRLFTINPLSTEPECSTVVIEYRPLAGLALSHETLAKYLRSFYGVGIRPESAAQHIAANVANCVLSEARVTVAGRTADGVAYECVAGSIDSGVKEVEEDEANR